MENFGPVWLGVVIAAVITAVVTTTGWFVNHARERALDEARRREKIIDMQEAIRAEIRAHVRELEEDETRGGGYLERLKKLHERLSADPAFKPIVPLERHDRVFDALVGDLHLLPKEVIEPVVAYYAKLATLTAFTEDLRGGKLRELDAPRLFEAFRDMTRLKSRTLELARAAVASLDHGIDALEHHGRWVSTRAPAPQAG